ncbi:MAG TPA: NUDIX hydrolase [Polyangiaceae bacterium]|nr:NUDIX hydrolase [Polyangiaceae bacterium]
MADEPAAKGPSLRVIPEGDTRPRLVCADCGFIHYENPKVVVGSLCTHEDKILLCRRAIEPRLGYWTLPAGFLELGETTIDGAKREAREEACAAIDIYALLAVYNIPRISQVQLIYLARLEGGRAAAGPESQEVGLFAWDDIPWQDIAFPSVHWALHHYRDVRGEKEFVTRTNPEGEWGDR